VREKVQRDQHRLISMHAWLLAQAVSTSPHSRPRRRSIAPLDCSAAGLFSFCLWW
jgi:hypothetical protein